MVTLVFLFHSLPTHALQSLLSLGKTKNLTINLSPKHSLPNYFGLPYQNSLRITPKHGTHFRLNPLNAELNPICHLLALFGAHDILHVSRIRVKEVTCRPHVRRFGFTPCAVPVESVVHKLALGQVSLLVFPFSRQYHSIDAAYSSSSTRCLYQKDERAKPRNLPKSNTVSKIGESAWSQILKH